MSDSKLRRYLALARIVAGAMFLHNALPKFSVGFLQSFGGSVRTAASGNPFPWYRTFLTDIVEPNDQIFGMLLAMGQLMIGLALIVGFLTGLACLFGILLTVLHILGTAHLTSAAGGFFPQGWENLNVWTLLLFILLFTGRAGRTWGLDARAGGKGWWW